MTIALPPGSGKEGALSINIEPAPDPVAPTRTRLPGRRLQVTEPIVAGGLRFILSVGFDRDGRAREAFVNVSHDLAEDERTGAAALKKGTGLAEVLDDACVLYSLVLQSGYDAAGVVEHLGGRIQCDFDGLSAQHDAELLDRKAREAGISVVRLVAEHVVRMERKNAIAVREAYRWSAGERPPMPEAQP